ncbi:methyl-accepting chemotaxis protein [Loktanella sp. R86503]|uniref:methyl-accepting chemotaxis protein n=1 Tax=Loktanella sp. R86503 TaxID=3093847 RepID=UPI0036DBDEB5
MVSSFINNTSLTAKVIILSIFSVLATSATLIVMFGVSSASLTQQLVTEAGASEAELLGNILYGPTRFDDSATAQDLLEATLNRSDGAAGAAIIVKTDGTTFAVAGTSPAEIEEFVQSELRQDIGDRLVRDNFILVPIRKSGSEQDAAVGFLGLDWRADNAIAALNDAEKQALFYAAFVACVVLGLVILGSRLLIIQPLNRQRETILKISLGDLEAQTKQDNRKDEIGAIARSTDKLRQKLLSAAADQYDATYKGAAFTSASSAIMVTSADYQIIYVNPAMVELLKKFKEFIPQLADGVSSEKVTGMNLDNFHDNGSMIREKLQAMGANPIKVLIPFGESRVSLQISQVLDGVGAEIGVVMEWSDVTEQWLSNAILRSLDSQQLRADFNRGGDLIYANENLYKVLGLSGDGNNTLSISSIISDNTSKESSVSDMINISTETGLFAGKLELIGVNKSKVIAEGTLSCVKDGVGKPVRYILIVRDVTLVENEIETTRVLRQRDQRDQTAVVEALRIGLRQLSNGDLTALIDNKFPDMYEDLRGDYNSAVDTLSRAIKEVVDRADSISNEARDISSNTDSLSRRTESTAATLEQTAVALNELTLSIKGAAEGSKDADTSVFEAKKNAEQSGLVVLEAVAAMDQISESSMRITSIIKVIDDIAFQTNLLALNAGVEAARAGDAGRGFAVVASEVRALAQRSSDAAREINGLIEQSSRQVNVGVNLVGKTGDALQQILSSVTKISDMVSEIAASSVVQSESLTEINNSIIQLDQSTQQNAARLEETTAASGSLRENAVALVKTASYFKLAQRNIAFETSDTNLDGQVVRFKSKAKGSSDLNILSSSVPRININFESEAAGWEDF